MIEYYYCKKSKTIHKNRTFFLFRFSITISEKFMFSSRKKRAPHTAILFSCLYKNNKNGTQKIIMPPKKLSRFIYALHKSCIDCYIPKLGIPWYIYVYIMKALPPKRTSFIYLMRMNVWVKKKNVKKRKRTNITKRKIS